MGYYAPVSNSKTNKPSKKAKSHNISCKLLLKHHEAHITLAMHFLHFSLQSFFKPLVWLFMVEGLYKCHALQLQQESGLSAMEQYAVKMSQGCPVKGAQSTGPQARSSIQREAGGEKLTPALKLL